MCGILSFHQLPNLESSPHRIRFVEIYIGGAGIQKKVVEKEMKTGQKF